MHSGRQLGGDPTYSIKQEHTAWPLIVLHWLLGPHGEGLHTSTGASTGESENIRKSLSSWFF